MANLLPIYSLKQLVEIVPKENYERFVAFKQDVKNYTYPENTAKKVLIYCLSVFGLIAGFYFILASLGLAPHLLNSFTPNIEKAIAFLLIAGALTSATLYCMRQRNLQADRQNKKENVIRQVKDLSLGCAVDDKIPELLKKDEILICRENATEYVIYVSSKSSLPLPSHRKTIKIEDGNLAEEQIRAVIGADFSTAKIVTKEQLIANQNVL